MINAYDAAIALGMNTTESADNQPYDLLSSDANWDIYVGGMTNGARLKGEAAVSLPELTSITMDPYKVAFYGMEVGEPSEAVDGVVTVEISMPAGMDPVENGSVIGVNQSGLGRSGDFGIVSVGSSDDCIVRILDLLRLSESSLHLSDLRSQGRGRSSHRIPRR